MQAGNVVFPVCSSVNSSRSIKLTSTGTEFMNELVKLCLSAFQFGFFAFGQAMIGGTASF
jgi:hypothetical protein